MGLPGICSPAKEVGGWEEEHLCGVTNSIPDLPAQGKLRLRWAEVLEAVVCLQSRASRLLPARTLLVWALTPQLPPALGLHLIYRCPKLRPLGSPACSCSSKQHTSFPPGVSHPQSLDFYLLTLQGIPSPCQAEDQVMGGTLEVWQSPRR